MVTITEDNRAAIFEAAYNGSYYTVTGCGGDLNEWEDGYDSILAQSGIGRPKKYFTFTGRDMNEHYSLTGENAYPDDLRFIMFALDGLKIGPLAAWKLRLGDRWFDDMVDNDTMRQRP